MLCIYRHKGQPPKQYRNIAGIGNDRSTVLTGAVSYKRGWKTVFLLYNT